MILSEMSIKICNFTSPSCKSGISASSKNALLQSIENECFPLSTPEILSLNSSLFSLLFTFSKLGCKYTAFFKPQKSGKHIFLKKTKRGHESRIPVAFSDIFYYWMTIPFILMIWLELFGALEITSMEAFCLPRRFCALKVSSRLADWPGAISIADIL